MEIKERMLFGLQKSIIKELNNERQFKGFKKLKDYANDKLHEIVKTFSDENVQIAKDKLSSPIVKNAEEIVKSVSYTVAQGYIESIKLSNEYKIYLKFQKIQKDEAFEKYITINNKGKEFENLLQTKYLGVEYFVNSAKFIDILKQSEDDIILESVEYKNNTMLLNKIKSFNDKELDKYILTKEQHDNINEYNDYLSEIKILNTKAFKEADKIIKNKSVKKLDVPQFLKIFNVVTSEEYKTYLDTVEKLAEERVLLIKESDELIDEIEDEEEKLKELSGKAATKKSNFIKKLNNKEKELTVRIKQNSKLIFESFNEKFKTIKTELLTDEINESIKEILEIGIDKITSCKNLMDSDDVKKAQDATCNFSNTNIAEIKENKKKIKIYEKNEDLIKDVLSLSQLDKINLNNYFTNPTIKRVFETTDRIKLSEHEIKLVNLSTTEEYIEAVKFLSSDDYLNSITYLELNNQDEVNRYFKSKEYLTLNKKMESEKYKESVVLLASPEYKNALNLLNSVEYKQNVLLSSKNLIDIFGYLFSKKVLKINKEQNMATISYNDHTNIFSKTFKVKIDVLEDFAAALQNEDGEFNNITILNILQNGENTTVIYSK